MSESAKVVPWLYWSIVPLHRALMHLYFGRITIIGRENLPQIGPAVFASKHASRWDSLVLALLSTESLRYMSRSDQMTGIQGWIVGCLGGFSVDPIHPTVSSMRTAIAVLHSGKKLVVFPEGGIVRDQPLRPLKTGLARLVLQAEATSTQPFSVPIVPISLYYSPTPAPRSEVFVVIGPSIQVQQYRRSNNKQTAQAVTEALQRSILDGLEREEEISKGSTEDKRL